MGNFFKFIGIVACLVLGALLLFAVFSDEEDSSTETKTEKVKTDEDGETKVKKDVKKTVKKEVKWTSDWGSGSVRSITESQFLKLVANYKGNKKVYIGDGPAIVDCYATWCGPCKALSPILDKMAKKYKGKLQIYKIDVDNAPNVSSAYNIRSIPFLIFCQGSSIKTQSGAPSQSDLEEIIEDMIGE